MIEAGVAQLAGASVLVVDDDPALRDLVCVFLERAGCIVGSAPDCAAALVQADGSRWQLAVLDVDLPDGNGIELAVRLRSRTTRPDLPVVFITGRPDAARRLCVAGVGRAMLVPKPFARAELLAAAARMLGNRTVAA